MATIPSYRTWSAGEVITAGELNTNVRDAGNFMLSTPIFEGRQTVAQNITNTTDTPITLDTEDVDSDDGHSTSTNTSRYTAQTAGRFLVAGGIGWAGNGNNRREAIVALNGARTNGSDVGIAVGGNTQPVYVPTRTKTVYMNGSTDYVEMWGWQDSTATVATNVASSGQPNLLVRWLATT